MIARNYRKRLFTSRWRDGILGVELASKLKVDQRTLFVGTIIDDTIKPWRKTTVKPVTMIKQK